jgi:nucleotidyltransferase/DNA polymerase involved in DNA repair
MRHVALQGVQMKIGCIFFPHFAVQVERMTNPSLQDRPLILGGDPHEKKTVYEASEDVMEKGVRRGMPLREACGLCPQAIFLPVDEKKYVAAFESILLILSSYTPVMEWAALGCAFMGLEDRCHELSVGKKISTLLTEKPLDACISFASSRFVSWAGSQTINPGQVLRIPPGREQEFLKDLPLDLLPGTEEILRRFKLFGLHTMGQLASLPIKAVDAEFGGLGKLLFELAEGIDRSRIKTWKPLEPLEEIHSPDVPAENCQEILAGAERVLDRLIARVNAWGKCSSKLTASLSLANGSVVRKVFHFKEPFHSNEVLLQRLAAWWGEAMFAAPVAQIKFSLADLHPREGKQIGLLEPRSRMGAGLASSLKSLQVRFGRGVVKRAVLSESKTALPEESFHFVEFG